MSESLKSLGPTIGFPVQILGDPSLKSHDTRRWSSDPHLRVSLQYLREIFQYLDQNDIHMYRLSSNLAPYATHPDHPQFHHQVEECRDELAEVGSMAKAQGLRLSFHPGQFIVLNSPEEDLAKRSVADLEIQASILDAMGLGDDAVVVLHVGGLYGDREAALERFALRYDALPSFVQRRLVLENDDARFSATDLLRLHEMIQVALVFDLHHHRCYNPEGLSEEEAASAFLETWSERRSRPKLHFSSPRTDWGYRYGSKDDSRAPVWTSHAEFADPFSFIEFYRKIMDPAPDVMLEAKAKDLAVLQLRKDIGRYAPDLDRLFARRGQPELEIAHP
ncbi:MAG: UV DNA damage repair endonuclease UvsE [Anaerolineales bacterium]|nr:UV DNA damage repair endonuclease UvsE [Anaerolineales bacterium]